PFGGLASRACGDHGRRWGRSSLIRINGRKIHPLIPDGTKSRTVRDMLCGKGRQMARMARLDEVLTTLDEGLPAALDRLMAFLRIPSISTDPAYAGRVREAAGWLQGELAALGFQATVEDTPGHPMVVARSQPGPGRSLLFYGHYDVQPVDPLALWGRDPFDPAIEDTPAGP